MEEPMAFYSEKEFRQGVAKYLGIGEDLLNFDTTIVPDDKVTGLLELIQGPNHILFPENLEGKPKTVNNVCRCLIYTDGGD
jgi:hypothetical protein